MIIDTHLHQIPFPLNTKYVEWMEKTGDKSYGPLYLWKKPAFEDLAVHLENMDSYGIDASVVTFSANIIAIIKASSSGKEEGILKTEWMNDQMISQREASGGRMLPTAWINPEYGMAAVKEMERTAAKGAVGFSVLTSYLDGSEGKFLEHPDYESFWEAASALELPVFIHFGSRYHAVKADKPMEGYMADTLFHAGMEQLVEDTICVSRLVLSGIFDRYPRVKVVMGQLGGLFPFMLERFDMLYTMYAAGAEAAGLQVTGKSSAAGMLRRLSDYTDSIYVDTHSMGQASIEAAVATLGKEHVMYGSDFPITPDEWGRKRGLEIIRDLNLDEEEKEAVLGKNAARLLKLEERGL